MSYTKDNHRVIEVPTAKVWVSDDIIRVVYKEYAEIDVEAQKEHFKIYSELLEKKMMPLLLEIESQVIITKEARDYCKKMERKQRFSAVAVVAATLAQKLLVQFYYRFYKPKDPFGIFQTTEEAEKWLQQYK